MERALIERLLEELRLGSSDLADPQTASRLGRILSARVLTTGTILRYKGQTQVSLRAIDTETTRVVATATGNCAIGGDVGEMARSVVGELQGKIVGAYPIRGRVMEVKEKQAVLKVGSLMGVAPGMKLLVKEESGKGLELRVLDVDERSCRAVCVDEAGSVQPGWRVEEIRG